MEGLRLTDSPPDYGPLSSRWEGMVALGRELAQWQATIRDATQVAPVAIVWPIRSFAAMPPADLTPKAFTLDCPLRTELVQLIRSCLDRQVGLQLIDEADVWRTRIDDRRLLVGKASFSHVLIPSCIVLHQRTLDKLREAARSGVTVLGAGKRPRWRQTADGLEPAHTDWYATMLPAEAVRALPRLVNLQPDGTDIRCATWKSGGKQQRLLINLGKEAKHVSIDGKNAVLEPGRIHKG